MLPGAVTELLQQACTAHPGWLAGAAVNTAVFAGGAPVLLKGLTASGMVNAWLLGTAVFAAFGTGGFALVCTYFLFGTAVSACGECVSASKGGRRTGRAGCAGTRNATQRNTHCNA